ncbi:IDEAL domain-containing protein [Alicyclobacillus cycloheptanicus]|uniref:IDEAL domain-containing protein n=1 Tax=Alicyclobacillus cycloheptanicus TaxID=1457 RepID=UPI002378FBC5|nr:IDEAL domain-containing protein [Alicyclobacillus cycloheptanicus]WDM00002.1 IDEAL domain-containing protein [Alicyclobacillus cycloheptanicus]
MADETLNLLRRLMIDQALEAGDKEAFRNLTGPNWKAFVLDTGDEPVETADPLAFLAEDPHFWDLRLYDTMALRPYVNYRFRDTINGVLYIGEIRIPLGWSGDIEAKFYPRPSNGPKLDPPAWFQSLLASTVAVLKLDRVE